MGWGMRCEWAERSDAERIYHDDEWGMPVRDDRGMFEQLTLRGAQAGLSLRTVLAKREQYRRAFHGYDIGRIAAMTDADMTLLAQDRGLIRHRLKLASVRQNARASLRIVDAGDSLAAFFWSFVGGEPIVNAWASAASVPVRSDVSDALSAALHARGFRFAGTAICYAFMQSVGMVDDHVAGCASCR